MRFCAIRFFVTQAPLATAPLRLIAPMKLGLKNIKAITYTDAEPNDYWSYRSDRGYSRYDGL